MQIFLSFYFNFIQAQKAWVIDCISICKFFVNSFSCNNKQGALSLWAKQEKDEKDYCHHISSRPDLMPANY